MPRMSYRPFEGVLRGASKVAVVAFLGLVAASCESSPAPAWADHIVEVNEMVDKRSHLIPASVVADAVYRAEGGAKAKVAYGVLSVKVRNAQEARQVCLNSIRNSRARWQKAGRPGDWLAFFAARWAPTKGATNDPTGLNSNWLRNVRAILAASRL